MHIHTNSYTVTAILIPVSSDFHSVSPMTNSENYKVRVALIFSFAY